MAIQHCGIFDKITGSVGNVTHQYVRGKHIARSKPGKRTSSTSLQDAHRLRFSIAVHITRQLKNPIQTLFWDPQFKRQTGFSMLFKSIITSLNSSNQLTTSSILTSSRVTPSEMFYFDYWPSDGLCDVDYRYSMDGFKSEDDQPYLIVYHKLSHTIWIKAGDLTRNFGTIQTTIATGLNPDDILFFLTHDLKNHPDLFCETSHGAQAVAGHFP